MSLQKETQDRLGWLKWLLVLLIIAAGVYGNWYFREESFLYRVLGLLGLAALAFVIAVQTTAGRSAWVLMKEARMEIRKVVWPTPQEVTQTTIIVLILVLLAALILWLLDWGFGSLAERLIG